MTHRTSFLLLSVLAGLISFALLSGAPAPVYKHRDPPKTITNSIGMKLAYIPPGKFSMGSPEDEAIRAKNEGPEHEVWITRPFYVGVYEVTQGEYEKVMGSNPSHFAATGGGKNMVKDTQTARLPVEQVGYNDAVKFCEKLSALKGDREKKRAYRLPTEAEWEYACRGGATSKTPCYFGKTLSSDQANFNGNFPYDGAPKSTHLGRTCVVDRKSVV